MKTISKMRNVIFILLVIMATIFISNENVFAAEVYNFEELKKEIKSGTDKEIKIMQAIEVTETLIIGRDVTISGGELKAESSLISSDTDFEIQRRSGNIFYLEKGKSLTLENITLDGNEKARIIFTEGGSIILKNATLQNGTTENFGKLEKAGDDKQNYSGGAILATQASKLDVTDGSFINNNTGSKYLDAKRAAEGGAIKIDSSELTVNGTTFTGNHLDSSADEGGRQGGAIEATNTTATINNATFDIVGPFNTGGAIKFEDCPQATVTGSTFTIAENKGQFGVAGGAITSEGSNLTIDNSTFNTGKGSYVQESGGLIQVADSGEFHLKNSTLNGSGVGWNETGANKTAKYGGAIVFYDDSSVTATIENTTIKNFTAEISGGGIALNTQVGKNGGTNLTLIDTKILNNLAYAYNMTAYGGGIFVGQGNTVTMKGGQISSKESSSVGGAIYNEGKVTLTKSEKGNAQIVNNKAYHMAGGVLNDGELTVDFAKFEGNTKGDWSTGDGHIYDKNEMGGKNIYAVKDVIITPNATFDDKDVRILDGQSKIILTGKLTNQINVSISEASKKQPDKTINDPRYPLHPKFNESQNRKVGYIVAAGDGSYTPTAEDAKKIHYVSKDTSQAIADFADDKSTGKWDFVLNPKTKDVVLGQRVKVTLHANGTDEAKAKFENVKLGRNKDEGIFTKLPSEDIKEDIYDVYAPGQKSAILDPEPVRKSYEFTGWYEEQKVNDDLPDKGKKGKTLVEDLKLVKDSNEITSIIDKHEYELFAGWKKVILVEKVWDDNNDEFSNRPDKVTVTLYERNEVSAGPIELNAKNGWKGEFKNIRPSKFGYTVKENPEQSPGYEEGVVSGNDKDGFKIINKTEFITIEGSKTWVHGENPKENQPTSVTVNLLENGKKIKEASGESWEFKDLPKYKNKNLVNYTLTENPVKNYTSAKGEGEYDFKNTYTDKFKVTYEFVSGTEDKTLPEDVTKLLPGEEKDKENGKKVTPSTSEFADVTTDDGTWSFVSWNPTEHIINGADVTFTGTWKFTKKEEPKIGSVYVKYLAEDGKVLEAESKVLENVEVGTEYTT
ncbi:MAG: Cna B-type domain-containing protein, partial [Peptoniphilus harei]|nr:Cna B-type domain-containing protein [Peptoniphilus harei]